MNSSRAVTTTESTGADALAMDEGHYARIALARIRISPDNRKRFGAQALQELADSIRDMGVAQPILLRPVLPTDAAPQEFEIVAGERRFRASTIAGVADIPAMVRTLTDRQAAKIRILENLQREDPHPMEEADGYQQLMLAHGYTADQLVGEIKKSRSYVFGRLKLCSLTTAVREQFLDEKVSASVALLIARIPVPPLQVKALGEILTPNYNGDLMSYRQAAAMLQQRYMLTLTTAVFDRGNAKLTQAAGACTGCTKRTGNQPEVYAEISADVCTDPDCFAEKTAAHYARIIELAEKNGIPVIEGEAAAKKLRERFYCDGDHVTTDTALHLFERNAPTTKNAGCQADFIGAWEMPKVALYARTQKGTIEELYERAAMQEALEKAGACETIEVHATRMQSIEKTAPRHEIARPPTAAHQAKELAAANETAFRGALYKRLRLHGATNGLSVQSLRDVTKMAISFMLYPDELKGDANGFDATSPASICAHADTASGPDLLLLLIDLLVGKTLAVGSWQVTGKQIEDGGFGTVLAMARHEGIDPEQVKEAMFPTPINVDAWAEADLLAFISKYPGRIDELTKIVLGHQRGELTGMLERAASALGYAYVDHFFKLKEAV